MEKQYIAMLKMVCVTYLSDNLNLMNLIKLHFRAVISAQEKVITIHTVSITCYVH